MLADNSENGLVGENVKHSYEIMQLKYPAGRNRFDDVKAYYDEWATSYDVDMTMLGYQDPIEITKVIKERVGSDFQSGDLKILDIGSGPGNVGKCLRKSGFVGTIYALDYSQNMLNQIPKRVYDGTIHHVMLPGKPLPSNGTSYNVITLAGTLGPSTMSPACLVDVVKVIKSGGYFIATTRTKYDNEPTFYDEIVKYFDQHVSDGLWVKTEQFLYNHYEWKEGNHKNEMKGMLHAYQVI